jgi:DNA (cytosine-5)-methyltransferase 1
MIQVGSLFSGIGGFDLGLERSFKKHSIDCKIAWQVEIDEYCKKILRKHWPGTKIYSDVRDITKNNVSHVDILIGGFPCQDLSVAGKQRGIHGKKSGLWWEMFRIIGELRPRIVVLENVPNIIRVGGRSVVGSFTSIGYDSEWTIISARQFGAPHLRKRWFLVAYPNSERSQEQPNITKSMEQKRVDCYEIQSPQSASKHRQELSSCGVAVVGSVLPSMGRKRQGERKGARLWQCNGYDRFGCVSLHSMRD